MTCEVAVMNRRGIALAADSAVTVGEGDKIYHTAEKLFALAQSTPVGIMTYGSADLIGVPWEIIIKMYSQSLAGRRFDTLDQYANDFFRFRFRKSKSVDAVFGLTCSRDQSGERDRPGAISLRGDEMMRAMLYEAAPEHAGAFEARVVDQEGTADRQAPR